ncbi:ninja-family protein mc410 [Silene latifolia]|uniref:ninja-family protein mc410 n=1 Tax=Silene latifolia TaxID=37657 RepID=UPI003D781E8F
MEDDRGIELSLGLGCGPTSSPSKDRSENSADDKMDTDERTSKILNDFRNFLNAGASQSSQRTDLAKPSENFFNNFTQTASGGNDLSNVDMKKHKNQETDSDSSDLQVKEVHSHISITTDDEGSTGDNEDMAESEVEVSMSKISPHCDNESRTPGGSASSSLAPKESDGKANISASSFPVQTVIAVSVPYSSTVKESPSTSSLNSPIYPLSMPSIPPTTVGHSHPHAASTGSAPVTLTYSSLQIPNKDSSWGMARSQPLHSPYATRLAPSSVSMQVNNPNSSEAIRPDVGPREQLRGLQKVVGQVGPSSQPVGNTTTRTSSSFPSEYPAIKPGIASEVKFGGSGSFPNLPWVSTTGPGPNGKTISGVTYKYNATQIKIVCACHGIHLSPEEFVRHASEDQSRVVPSTGLASLRSSNPGTTSAMS